MGGVVRGLGARGVVQDLPTKLRSSPSFVMSLSRPLKKPGIVSVADTKKSGLST